VVYRVGDRVRVINGFGAFEIGETGTVVRDNTNTNSVGVRFDEYNNNRHDCVLLCKEGYGWFLLDKWVEMLNKNETIVQYADRIKNGRRFDNEDR